MKTNTGFTLIEVLIAMLVLAVGLLGLAGLQATSLRNNQSAYNRSQATQLAYDIADRMRANVAGIATYTAIKPISAAGAQAHCLAVSTPPTCTTADMAENDLFEWNRAVRTTLPLGKGAIGEAAGVFTITVSWDDDRDGEVDDLHDGKGNIDNDEDSDDDPHFQTSFKL